MNLLKDIRQWGWWRRRSTTSFPNCLVRSISSTVRSAGKYGLRLTNQEITSESLKSKEIFLKSGVNRTSLGNGDDHVCVLMSYSDGGVGDLREQVHQVTHAVVHDLPVSGEAPDERRSTNELKTSNDLKRQIHKKKELQK